MTFEASFFGWILVRSLSGDFCCFSVHLVLQPELLHKVMRFDFVQPIVLRVVAIADKLDCVVNSGVDTALLRAEAAY